MKVLPDQRRQLQQPLDEREQMAYILHTRKLRQELRRQRQIRTWRIGMILLAAGILAVGLYGVFS